MAWLLSGALLFFASCTENEEKRLASGYTEEQNANFIKDTVAYMALLKTWEPLVPVDSSKKVLSDDENVFWYDVNFVSDGEVYYSKVSDNAENSQSCTVDYYEDENGVRLTLNTKSTKNFYTQILNRDSMLAVVVDRLDNTYETDDAWAQCSKDSLEFVQTCEKENGVVVDQLGLASCTELHLICNRELTPNLTAGEYLTRTADSLKQTCVNEMETSLRGKIPWLYMNPEIEYGEVVDARDGQVYKTVVIDSFVWMAENLNYADSIATPSLLGKNWCYDNEPDSCAKYGRIYTYGAIIDSVALANDENEPQSCGYGFYCKEYPNRQGICMDGWYLPSTTEYNNLEDQFSTFDEGNDAKSAYLWPLVNDDTYGFSLLPAGYYLLEENRFKDAGKSAFLWILKDVNEEFAYHLYFEDGVNSIATGTRITVDEKNLYAMPVRCVKAAF